MQFDQFTKDNLSIMRAEIQTALNTIGAKYGLTAKLGNITFNEVEFNSKVTVKIAGKVKDYSKDYFFLPPIGTKFTVQGRNFEVTEHKPSSPKFDVRATEIGKGGSYKFNSEVVNRLAGRQSGSLTMVTPEYVNNLLQSKK